MRRTTRGFPGGASELRTIAAGIEVTTPADKNVGLAAGAGALKLFIFELVDDGDGVESDLPDITVLTKAGEAAHSGLAWVEGAQDGAVDALRPVEEEENASLATAKAAAIAFVQRRRNLRIATRPYARSSTRAHMLAIIWV